MASTRALYAPLGRLRTFTQEVHETSPSRAFDCPLTDCLSHGYFDCCLTENWGRNLRQVKLPSLVRRFHNYEMPSKLGCHITTL